jgi:hypothetical protein
MQQNHGLKIRVSVVRFRLPIKGSSRLIPNPAWPIPVLLFLFSVRCQQGTVCRQNYCNTAQAFEAGADYRCHHHDRYGKKHAGNTPDHAPESQRQNDHERTQIKRFAHEGRFDHVAHNKLDGAQAHRDQEDGAPSHVSSPSENRTDLTKRKRWSPPNTSPKFAITTEPSVIIESLITKRRHPPQHHVRRPAGFAGTGR